MKANKQIKIMIADDHILLRDALARLINDFDECKVTEVAANGEELIKILEKGIKPDIIILDLNMPKLDGYGAAEWLKKHRPEIRVLILSMFDSEVPMIRLLQTGVRGFLKKDISPADLRAAIHLVTEDGYYYSNSVTGKLAAFFLRDTKGQSALEKGILTDREIEFLKLAATDMTYKEMASEMKITARMIDNCRDGLFEKLDVKSRVGLAIYAVKNGIISF